jgi:hypothetical protein
LKVVFAGNAISGIEIVIDICVYLVCFKRCIRAHDKSVIAKSGLRGWISDGLGRDEELAIRIFKIHDLQRNWIDT